MILKVQIPITTNDPEPKALVYDRSRHYNRQVEITPDLKERMEDSQKKFFEGFFFADGSLFLGKEVADPGW